jgi:hypothetical protein
MFLWILMISRTFQMQFDVALCESLLINSSSFAEGILIHTHLLSLHLNNLLIKSCKDQLYLFSISHFNLDISFFSVFTQWFLLCCIPDANDTTLPEQSDNTGRILTANNQQQAAIGSARGSLQPEIVSHEQVRAAASPAIRSHSTNMPASVADANSFAGAQRPSWNALKVRPNFMTRSQGSRFGGLNSFAVRTSLPRGNVTAAFPRLSRGSLRENHEQFRPRFNQTFLLRSPRTACANLRRIKSQPSNFRVSMHLVCSGWVHHVY